MSAQWYTYQNGGEQKGPYTDDQLKELVAARELNRQDMLWNEGTQQWAEAGLLRGLFEPASPGKVKRETKSPNRATAVEASLSEPLAPSTDGSPSKEAQIAMIECRVCHKRIAANAVTCPACGAPNSWLHPEILRFSQAIKEVNFLPARSQVSWRAYRVWGSGFTKPPGQNTGLAKSHPMNWGPKLMIAGVLLGLLGGFNGGNPFTLSIASIILLIGLLGSLVGMLSDTVPVDVAVDRPVSFELDFAYTPPKWSCTDEQYWAGVHTFFNL
jgi:hypothetical protein